MHKFLRSELDSLQLQKCHVPEINQFRSISKHVEDIRLPIPKNTVLFSNADRHDKTGRMLGELIRSKRR